MTGSEHPKIFSIGEVLWDLQPKGRTLGGTVANFSYFCRVLGCDVTLVSRVGEDEDGHELVSAIEERGLGTEHIQYDPHYPTGTVDVEVDADGEPKFTIHKQVAWDFIEPMPVFNEIADSADLIYFGTLAQREKVSQKTIRQTVKEHGESCKVFCDINLRQDFYTAETVKWSLLHSDIVKVNTSELKEIGEIASFYGDLNGVAYALIEKFGLEALALTRGDEGSVIFTDEGASEHPGYPAEVVDSVGAGDAFAAVLGVGLVQEDDIDLINDRANQIAAFVCSRQGATPEVPEKLIF